ncbi:MULTISPECIES: hypothetical protein [Streptomyces]|uniref:Uncharacterized protein n=1 Tax=Streptomyces dengpaensis TaxID=2049881 RepID=A0ABN5IA23_9ACTN|nr:MULTISPECIES: hypothetical protein [Streptomyces]AVH60003.1 hypothetical protein C4B68_34195 [Streptomyces dengpaensis]PIB09641.1 hypothetical protein B1C81_10870 [Streptomyces sp. HG99]
MAAAKKTAASVRAKQFPAQEGEPETEVDERSADGAEGLRYVKEFVVLKTSWPARDEDEAHKANGAAVCNEAIQRGLHPRGDVSFDGAEDHPDGYSVTLTYSVRTVPSSVDDTPQDTTTPRDVIEGTE